MDSFMKLYINLRPVLPLNTAQILSAFETIAKRYVTPRTSPSLLLSCFMHYNRSFTNVALLILKLSLNLSVPLPQPREGGGCSLGGAKEGAAFGGRGHRRLGLGGLSGGPGGCRGHSRGQGRVRRLSICRQCTRLRKRLSNMTWTSRQITELENLGNITFLRACM